MGFGRDRLGDNAVRHVTVATDADRGEHEQGAGTEAEGEEAGNV